LQVAIAPFINILANGCQSLPIKELIMEATSSTSQLELTVLREGLSTPVLAAALTGCCPLCPILSLISLYHGLVLYLSLTVARADSGG
jgi:hypothetical protein